MQEQQQKMIEDLDTMNAMIDSTLVFPRTTPSERREGWWISAFSWEMSAKTSVTREKTSPTKRTRHRCSVPADIDAIVPLLTLLDNAISMADARAFGLLGTDRGVVIIVNDNGPGVPTAGTEGCCPFYRLEARDPAKAGVGLGLSISSGGKYRS